MNLYLTVGFLTTQKGILIFKTYNMYSFGVAENMFSGRYLKLLD